MVHAELGHMCEGWRDRYVFRWNWCRFVECNGASEST